MNEFEVLIESTDGLRSSLRLLQFMEHHGWVSSRPRERPDYYKCTTALDAEEFKSFLESEIREAFDEVVVVTVSAPVDWSFDLVPTSNDFCQEQSAGSSKRPLPS